MLKLRQKFRIANIVMWGKVMPSKCLFVDIWNTPYLQESWADNSFWPTSLRCLPKEKLFWNNRRVQLIVGKHSVLTLQVWTIPTYRKKINNKNRVMELSHWSSAGKHPTSFEDMMIPNPHVHVSSCNGFYLPKHRMCLGLIPCIHRICISMIILIY